MQNVFTVTKAFSLAALVVLGFWFSTAAARAVNFTNFWRNAALSVEASLSARPSRVDDRNAHSDRRGHGRFAFSMDAWNNITFTAAEVKNPGRDLPLSLVLGTGIVISLYTLANLAYLRVLPISGDPHGATALARGIEFAADGRVHRRPGGDFRPGGRDCDGGGHPGFHLWLQQRPDSFGRADLLCDGQGPAVFSVRGQCEPASRAGVALVVQCIWASVLCLSGTYGQLLDFLIFAVLIFYILTLVGLFVLRWKRPEMPRPYRAFGYPVLPALYIVMAIFVEIQLLRYKPQYTWPG